MDLKATRDGYADALIELAAEDERIIVLDSDVAKATKTEKFAARFPDRFLNCGVQEANMMSVAAGLSLEGFIPFASTFGVFASCRALDQVRNSIAYPKLNVKIGCSHCGITVGADGASHQANEDIAIFRAIPNMTIIVPGDYYETVMATKAAAKYEGPVYLRFGRDVYPVVEQLRDNFEIGKAKLLCEGEDICIISTGIMTASALEVAQLLEKDDLSVSVLHVHTIKPLDVESILNAADAADIVFTIEEHSVIGGLGEAVASTIAEHRPSLVYRIGMPDAFGESGSAPELLIKYKLTPQAIACSIRQRLSIKQK